MFTAQKLRHITVENRLIKLISTYNLYECESNFGTHIQLNLFSSFSGVKARQT